MRITDVKKYDEKTFYEKFAQSEIEGYDYLLSLDVEKSAEDLIKDLKYIASEVNNGYPYETYKAYRETQLGRLGINMTAIWRRQVGDKEEI